MDLLMDAQPRWIVAGAALLLTTIAFLKVFLGSGGSSKRVPPMIPGTPVVGGLLRFLGGPILLIRAEYAHLGLVFTVPILTHRITFLIGPEVSAHFFKSDGSDMSQQEVYRFNVPTFGPGVVFDIDYQVRQEQFKFSTEAGAHGIQRHMHRSGGSASIRPRCEAGSSRGEARTGIDWKHGIRLQSMHSRAHRFNRRFTRTTLLPPNDDARPAVISLARLGSSSNEARHPAVPPSGG